MADVLPLRALHHDLARVGPLADLIGPPYDVVDPAERALLAARSAYNVVHLDLPTTYADAAARLLRWQDDGVLVRDDADAVWVLEQRFGGRARRGLLCRVRIDDAVVHPHERTHAAAVQDRLALTRATRTNLSPVFALHDGDAITPLGDLGTPYAETDDLTLWRVPDAAPAVAALRDEELLIADGHHRYETARAYAEEAGGGDGPHRFVLMCLTSTADPGLLVLPTHRLVRVPDPEALARTLRAHFHIEALGSLEELPPPPGEGPAQFGYVDAHFRRPFRLTAKDPVPGPLGEVDAAVLEARVPLAPDYGRSDAETLEQVLDGSYDAAFFLRPAPVAQVRRVAAAGLTMPPKSTSFVPKVPAGLLFSPLT